MHLNYITEREVTDTQPSLRPPGQFVSFNFNHSMRDLFSTCVETRFNFLHQLKARVPPHDFQSGVGVRHNMAMKQAKPADGRCMPFPAALAIAALEADLSWRTSSANISLKAFCPKVCAKIICSARKAWVPKGRQHLLRRPKPACLLRPQVVARLIVQQHI